MPQLQNNLKIGIASLGLIGGSIYKSLKEKGYKEIIAYTQNEETILQIKRDGHKASSDIYVLENCDLVFVCSPISKTIEMIKKICKINPTAIIADTASLKSNILEEIEKKTKCKFIGSHPMAGTEHSGFEHSDAELFKDSKWILTPSKFVNDTEVKLLENIILSIEAKPLIMEAKEHDTSVALVSHTPMLLSQSLILSIIDDNKTLKLASSGFRDTTRLAMSNKTMAKDMLIYNKKNIQKALKKIIETANKLLQSEYFDKNIDQIISKRKTMYNSEGKNNL